MKRQGEIKFELKTMSPEEISFALDWAADEGWNPGVYDAESFYNADPKGFFIGELYGRPIGCISAVRYSNNYGFFGLFIVEEEFRRQWFGAYLARTALSYLGKRNIGLNGEPDKIDIYKKIGFKFAYNVLEFEATGKGHITKDITDAKDIPFEQLVKYDAKMFSAKRPDFLKTWISQPESSAICIYRNKKIQGFGVIRKSNSGFRIGPLFADTLNDAETIYVALSSTAPHENIYLEIPEKNKAALALAKKFEMNKISQTSRMYSLYQPDFPLSNVFAFTNSELG